MSTNLKILLASIGTIIATLAIGGYIHDCIEIDELVKRGEEQRKATKEIEKIYVKDTEEFEKLCKMFNAEI